MQINTEKITRQLCHSATVVLFPRSIDEALFIQNQFFKMGIVWGKGSYSFEDGSTRLSSDQRVLEGLFLTKKDDKTVLFAGIGSHERKEGLLCTVDQFEEKYQSPHEQVMAAFNKIARRLDKIEADIAEIKKEVIPQQLNKPRLNNPGA